MDRVDRFLNRKIVKEELGENYKLTVYQELQLRKLLYSFDVISKYAEYLKTFCCFIKSDVKHYTQRYKRLSKLPASPSLYSFLLRYGKDGYTRYKDSSANKSKLFKNTKEYWIKQGYTEEESINKVSEVQTERANLAADKLRGTSEYTCRSLTYWLKKGYSLDDAQTEVKRVQVTNGIQYYVSTGLSLEDAKKMQHSRNSEWLKTLDLKSQEEKDLINLKKSHSIEGYIASGYSPDEALNKSVEYFSKRKNYSAISQDMFDLINETYNLNECYYATKNREFQIFNKHLDFYEPNSGVVVEFYGDWWHMNPTMHTEDEICYGRTAKEIWDYDAKRIQLITSHEHVKHVIIIWESEYIKNPHACIEKLKEYFK